MHVPLSLLLIALLTGGGCARSLTDAPAPGPVAPPRGHAHNDYENDRPLLDALFHGFGSVEADIFLADLGDGPDLHVGHDRDDLEPGRTLRSLYLEPLVEQIGETVPHRPLILLIDIKSGAGPTWRELERQLKPYASILTSYRNGEVEERAVTVVISGDRPRQLMLDQANRRTFYDGRPEEVADDLPPSFMPLVSADWGTMFDWQGGGPFPDNQRRQLRRYVRDLHASGYKVRFWAAPDSPAAWEELLAAGVDLINTDDLAGLARFLHARAARAATDGPGTQEP